VAFAWLYGGVLLPRAVPSASDEQTLTVMTLNVLWPNEDYARIAGAIEEASPDIVAMQELRPQHLPGIQAALGEPYPYQVFSPRDEQFHRVGLLSRYPVESVTQLENPPFERAILVRVRAGDRPLAVVVAHLTPTNMLDEGPRRIPAVVARRYARRVAQASALVELARVEGWPVVVACDCNFTSTSEAYAAMLPGFGDSFAEAGWGLGHTMRAPLVRVPALRLDYVWHTPELRAVEARLGADTGSDHLPVVARLAWP
jgi:vancomycin resistance protein VanJ